MHPIPNLCEESIQATLNPAFSQHPQFVWLADTLARARQHHAILEVPPEEQWHQALAEGFACYLGTQAVPAVLKNASCFYLTGTLHPGMLPTENGIQIIFWSHAGHAPAPDAAHPGRRFVLLFSGRTGHTHHFARAVLAPPSHADRLAVLRHACLQLEQCHHVRLPDTLPEQALLLADKWLAGTSRLKRALCLLDSAAARVASDSLQTEAPVLSARLLQQTVADWTGVPLTCLQENPLQSPGLAALLQKAVPGQENAIQAIATRLQAACLRLPGQAGPFCHFFLTGPRHSGKTALAWALSQAMTGRSDTLLKIGPTDVRDNRLAAVRDLPHRVILAENMEGMPPEALTLFREILLSGSLRHADGTETAFRHAVLIFTLDSDPFTGKEKTEKGVSMLPNENKNDGREETGDLLQLVMGQSGRSQTDSFLPAPPAPADLSFLTDVLPGWFLQRMHPVSFSPLGYTATEKILQKELSTFQARMNTQTGLQLDIAPEILHFLTKSLLQASIRPAADALIEQLLYPPLALSLSAGRHSGRRLRIRLNHTGEVPVCEPVLPQEIHS